jgi:hypothetical protein
MDSLQSVASAQAAKTDMLFMDNESETLKAA